MLKRTGQLSIASFVPAAAETSEISAKADIQAQLRETASQYASKADVREVVASHTKELEEVLEREEIFKSPLTELVDRPASLDEEVSSMKRTTVTTALEGGISTATIKFGAPTSEGRLLVVVKPELDYSHALVTQNRGNNRESFAIVSPSVGESHTSNVITTSTCCIKSTTCHGICGVGGNCDCVATEVKCCNGNCVEGETDFSGSGCADICEPSSPCMGVDCPSC